MWLFNKIFWSENNKVFDKKDSYKIFVFDTETTWTDEYKDQIVQFSWIIWTLTTDEYCNFTFQEEKIINEFINIEWDIPEEASKIHWIYKKDIKDCKDLSYYINDLAKIINDVDFVVWHNVEFDLGILDNEETRIIKEENNNNSYRDKKLINSYRINKIDTMTSSTEIVNWRWWKWPKLSELYRFLFYHDFKWAHNSLSDVKATLECFLELAKRYRVYDVIFYPWLITRDYNKDSFRRIVDNGYINYLQYVSDEQFEYIIKNKYDWHNFSMKRLKELTDKQAEILANNFNWWTLSLPWLQKINNNQALSLSSLYNTPYEWHVKENSHVRYFKEKRKIELDWLTEINDSQAFNLIECTTFCNNRGEVSLKGLTKITDKQAEYLSKVSYMLYLPNLETITGKQAEIIIKNRGRLCVSSKFTPPIDQEISWDHYYTVYDETELSKFPNPAPVSYCIGDDCSDYSDYDYFPY